MKTSKNDQEKSTRSAPQPEAPFERPSPPEPWISFQTRLYSCPFCPRDEPFVVDHPNELARHMLKEHEIYFDVGVTSMGVNRISDMTGIEVNRYDELSDEPIRYGCMPGCPDYEEHGLFACNECITAWQMYTDYFNKVLQGG